jgi:hypothetical protein
MTKFKMKKLLLVVSILFTSLFIVQKADAACVTMNVSLSADGNWPAGESVTVSCIGDNPPGPSQCTGDEKTIKPGEKVTLTQCTCPDGGDPDSGCLVVKSKPAQCSEPVAKKYDGAYCSSNGHTIDTPLTAKCEAPPTPSPVCEAAYCEHWGDPAPTCVKDGKTYYKAYRECKLDGKTVGYPEEECGSVPQCEIPSNSPTATPTPTGGPQCNADCTANPDYCLQAPDGCTVCTDNGSGNKTCQPPSGTPPPDTTPPASTPPVSTPPASTPPVSTPPVVTNTPPPATPTPDFSEAMCKCDGMTASQIIPGQPAIFTATSKVTGSDVTKAEVKQIEFLLAAGNDPTNRQRIAGPERVNTTASGTSTEMKYTAQWTVNIPAQVQKNVEYQARATIKCTRKTTAQAYPYTAMVLGETESKEGLFFVIADFFKNLFNRSDSQTSNESDQDKQPTAQEDFASIAEQNNIQLGSFAPAQIIENKCPVIKFKFQ